MSDELKKRNNVCGGCKQPKTHDYWCRPCNAKRFQRNFKNWNSGNDDVDKFIQKTQLEATSVGKVLEWIGHDRFENIKYLTKGGFGTVYKAIWKDGPIYRWDFGNNQWKRISNNYPVALKCLHNSQEITAEFLKEVRFFYNF